MNAEDQLTFLIISNSFIVLGSIITLAFKLRHCKSSCCEREVFDLKSSISADLKRFEKKEEEYTTK